MRITAKGRLSECAIEDKRLNTHQAGGLRVNQAPCTRTPEAFDLRLRNSLPS